jgi:hypothetical protein
VADGGAVYDMAPQLPLFEDSDFPSSNLSSPFFFRIILM